jgi:hypothetical protein
MTSGRQNRNVRTAAGRKLVPLGEHAAVGSGLCGVAVMGETAALGWLVVDCCQCTRAIAVDAPLHPRKLVHCADNIRLTCPQCGYSADYAPSEARLCQGRWAPGARRSG